MGKRAEEVLDLADYEALVDYLHHNHSVYMRVDSKMYYLTDVNFEAWRAQDTSKLNHKNHYTDCTDLCPTLDEFLSIPFIHGETIEKVFSQCKFYASLSGDKD